MEEEVVEVAVAVASSHKQNGTVSINDNLGDDELRAVLSRLESDKDKETFGLVCKRWLHLQNTQRKKLCVRAGPHLLRRLAARFTCLLELDLSQSLSRSFYPGVTDNDLAAIASSFSCLRVLRLHNCKGITDSGMVAIGSGLSSLQFLDVSYCRKLTDKGLSAVAMGCHDLKALHLAGCRFVTDASLRALSENCRNLEELGLQGCNSITDSGLAKLVEGCRKIRHLDVNKCTNIGNGGISNICKACSSSLHTLKILDCYKVGDESMLSLAENCKNLETLIIGGCRNVSNKSIMAIASACSHSLKNMRMDWCLNLSDSSLDQILSLCTKLEVLDIGCCEEVTDVAFQGLGNEDLKLNLRILRISNCPKITTVGIGKLLKSCDLLEYLDVRSCPHVTKAGCDEVGLLFPECCKVNFSGSLAEPDVLS